MYSSYMCLIYSRICFLMKSDPRTYHMDGPPMGYELGDREWETPSSSSIVEDPEWQPSMSVIRDSEFESYMVDKRYMAENRASKRNVISYMAETRNADDTHKNVGKKRCTEGSESL